MECIICLDICTTFYFEYNCNHKYCMICFIKVVFFKENNKCIICKIESDVLFNTNINNIDNKINYKTKIKNKFGINLNMYCSKEQYNLLIHLFDYKCVICFKTFNTKYNLIEHLKSHNFITCDICIMNSSLLPFEYPLFKPFDLINHKKGLFVNILCVELIENELKKYKIKYKTEIKFESTNGHPKCFYCKIYFYDEFILKDHCNKTHFICKLCLRSNKYKYFKSINKLKEHSLETHRLLNCCSKNINSFINIKDIEDLFVENDINFMEHNLKIHKKKILINCSSINKNTIPFFDPFYLKREVTNNINNISSFKTNKFLNESLIKKDFKEVSKLIPLDLNRNLIKFDIKIPIKSKNSKEILRNINEVIIKYKNSDISFNNLLDTIKLLITNGEIINLLSTYRYLFIDIKDESKFKKCIEELKFPPFESKFNLKINYNKIDKKKTNTSTKYKFIDLTK